MHYLEVSLELSKKLDYPITDIALKTQLMAVIKQLLGTKGTAYKVDILKYNPLEQSFILRCDSEHYVRLRAALTLATTFEGTPCSYNVHRASRNLLYFTANSRIYKH